MDQIVHYMNKHAEDAPNPNQATQPRHPICSKSHASAAIAAICQQLNET